MGLFGGFRAKFTASNVPKSAKSKKSEVVCLKYHEISEFDSPQTSTPIRSNIKKTEVIKQHSIKPRPSIVDNPGIFENNRQPTPILSSTPEVPKNKDKTNKKQHINASLSTNQSTNSPPVKKDTQLSTTNGNHGNQKQNNASLVKKTKPPLPIRQDDNIQVSTSIQMPLTTNGTNVAIVDTKLKRDVEQINGKQSELIKIETNKHLYRSNQGKTIEEHEQTFATFKSDGQTSDSQNHDKSTLIFMTQNGGGNSPFNDRKQSETSSDFTINFARHDKKYLTQDHSEDEVSDHEEYSNFNSLDFSSQAASIFFGGDMEPEVVRPRNIKLDDNGTRRDSIDC